ncbi:MAG: TusE/DsrC/DsvC family sulfur relay protein [Demequinaceae bacterium]|nr:TusE/DsrC/DsvC family sulfur relay protein [Demequinaceae bacterium]
MPTQNMLGREIHVDDEGFLTEPDEWDEALGAELAKQIDIEMTDRHWEVVRFLRADFSERGETATTRRVDSVGGFSVKEQFALFPKKPAKKMAYVAGLPKPHGCV